MKKRLERSSKLLTLSPYMDDAGVIRVKGRIDSADTIPVSTRRPVILPRAHHVTDLIVSLYHRRWKHQNEGTIIAGIRRKFWIPHMRVAERRAARECQECKIDRAQPETPLMGPLPQDMLTPFVRPFAYVGLDYMGPFFVTIGRRKEKRWIALFTCLTTRAVHMEVARDLSMDSCLLCIRNFTSRRGIPVRIRSDKATSFIGEDNELQRQLADFDSGKIADTLANKRIESVFNTPLNPHAGGCWERLVRSVKRAMGHALYNENLQEHCLYSLMCEAENMVNSRPLTHIPIDTPTDEPITPNHFLLGTANTEQTPHPREEEHRASRTQWRKVQQAQHRLWKKWISEYLPDLCRRTKWYQPVQPLRVGDVVLVVDSNIHSSRWPLGLVTQVFPGKDLQVRSAEVQTRAGIFKRPACLLAKLDVGESV
ncbi:PREDICTED: uncharacterized protein LOC108360867 [Rhagoletis zephyria]|uniref:uncharacterized protein LOC108360867 n=1 Tax=Rhagoletis zephyria TaxID=28612 RepID=UPI0008115CDC|nr:PREDICTED: uncharacterized protein LOC108360867 [Rhagoletis zephyria]